MSKFFKVLSLVFALTLMTTQVFAETIGVSNPISVSVTMGALGTGSMSVTIRNRSDDSTATSLGFTTSSATLSAPWIASSQYLDVVYSATWNATWGVRIVTDNEDLEGDTNNTIDTIAPAYDDALLTKANYGGLLNTAEIVKSTQDPSKRAAWAWQVYDSTQTSITAPSSSIAPDAVLGGTVLSDTSATIGAWNAPWAYIGDKNNTTYTGDILEDGDIDGYVDDLTYGMVLVGASGGGNGILAQHPATTTTKTGDTTGIDIYLAARFANTNWGTVVGDPPSAYVLPAGTYNASLYIELIHE